MNRYNFPTRVVLELTPECNLNCTMCPRAYISGKDGFMDIRLWNKTISEISEKSPESIILPFWRGESILHRKFDAMIQSALDFNLKIHMCTNAHSLSQANIETLKMVEFVTFSIHSKRGYENAKKFAAMKTSKFPTTQISFVDCEKTTTDILPEVLNDNKLFGFDSVRLYVEHSIDGDFGKSKENMNYANNLEKRTFCQKLTDTLVIAYNGHISRCNHIWEPITSLNASTETIEDIWNSDKLNVIVDNYPDRLCLKCDQWTGHTQGESWRIENGEIKHILF
ncbi:MAG: radical SAM/SPASM domain-containing protein [Planctomycetota bacterium]|jgi:MoaA/NifB/PqqE/SkfB family radical SAM enzyme